MSVRAGCFQRRSTLERTIFRIDPAFRDEGNAGNLHILPARFSLRTEPFHDVSLAIRRGRNHQDSEIFGRVPKHEVHDFAMSADIERSNEDIGTRLNKPALQSASNRRRDIIANEDSHGRRDWGLEIGDWEWRLGMESFLFPSTLIFQPSTLRSAVGVDEPAGRLRDLRRGPRRVFSNPPASGGASGFPQLSV